MSWWALLRRTDIAFRTEPVGQATDQQRDREADATQRCDTEDVDPAQTLVRRMTPMR